MTQQPDPFSELRGLKAELAAYRAGCIDARSWGGPTMYPPHPITEVRAGEMAKLLGALLDERDRLIGALKGSAELGEIVARSYVDEHKPDTLRDPKTGEEVTGLIAETVVALIQAVIANGQAARSALSQEIG